MALPSLTLRNTKGSALTYTELDNNFTNLSTATLNVVVGTTTTNLSLNDSLTLVAGANVTLTGNSSTKTVTIAASGGSSGITDVVQDLTPQLGGDLDVNGKKITSASNGNIIVEPNGTGLLLLSSNEIWVGDADTAVTVTSNGAGNLKLTTNSGSVNSGVIQINQGANANISITPNGTGNVVIDGQNWPQSTGSANQFLKTDGAGQTSWSALTTATAATVGGIKVGSGLSITGDGTLSATAQALTTATASTLGGVKIGSGISITGDGTISASGGGGDSVYAGGTVANAGTYTANLNSGTVHTITLSNNSGSAGTATIALPTNMTAGKSITLIITQPSASYCVASWGAYKFAGGYKVLSNASSAIDIVSIFYDGTNYYAGLTKAYA